MKKSYATPLLEVRYIESIDILSISNGLYGDDPYDIWQGGDEL